MIRVSPTVGDHVRFDRGILNYAYKGELVDADVIHLAGTFARIVFSHPLDGRQDEAVVSWKSLHRTNGRNA